MVYIATDPDADLNTSVGDGQCVAYVKKAAKTPASSLWAEGEHVRGADLQRGTAIAMFQDREYKNATNGTSHAAIYLGQDGKGIQVHDQWVKKGGERHVVQPRTIRFKGGKGLPVDDGDAYSVIA